MRNAALGLSAVLLAGSGPAERLGQVGSREAGCGGRSGGRAIARKLRAGLGLLKGWKLGLVILSGL